MHRRPFLTVAVALFALLPVAAGCSSETKDKANEAVESAKDDADAAVDSAKEDVASAADEARARAAAEALQVGLRATSRNDAAGLRSVEAIQEAADKLPGDGEFSGIEDADGDGADDDGLVQVTVGDARACLRIPETGTDTTVVEGACDA